MLEGLVGSGMSIDLLWDRKVALEQACDEEDILAELLGLFRDTTAVDLESIKRGIASRNSDAVVYAAHRIKGAAASLAIEGIRLAAHAVEKSARDGDLSSAAASAENLYSLCEHMNSLR